MIPSNAIIIVLLAPTMRIASMRSARVSTPGTGSTTVRRAGIPEPRYTAIAMMKAANE